MKNTKKNVGITITKLQVKRHNLFIIAIAVIIGFYFTACGDSSGGSTATGGGVSPTSTKYTSVNGSNLDVYDLNIGSQAGDAYTLTIYANDTKLKGKSTGTISSVSGSTYTLSGGTSFTVTISGSSMTNISGTINLTGGSVNTYTAPGTVVSLKNGGDNSLNGTWKKSNETVRFNGSSFSYTDGNITAPGTAIYGDGILVTTGTYGKDVWVVSGRYKVDNIKIEFSGFNSVDIQYNGSWIKQ